MKTTVDIPAEELAEAIQHTGAKTKREAILAALRELNRRKRVEALAAQFGTFEDFMTQEDLRRMREAS